MQKINSPFEHLLQMFLVEQKEAYAKIGVIFREELTNPYGFFHGGFLATLADTTAATALIGLSLPGPFLTGELKIRYKSPSSAPEIYAESHAHQIKLNYWENRVKIIDKNNTLIAFAIVKSFLPNWKQSKP